ncbi:MAG: hypothetical protein KC505_01780 [Myxococcales bacterium]|nr:hypothetical protein [Myxococcales bacterium]USN50062.1 MAG: hypothetical protein H6731_07250 [Myxococcales bacterium]
MAGDTEILLVSELRDIESQRISAEIIAKNLSKAEKYAYKMFLSKVNEKIDTHLEEHGAISKEELRAIVRREIKQFSIQSSTTFVLFTSYIGLNMLYAWGVAQIPYPALTSTLYTLQTILGISLSAPILTPWISRFRNWAFNFRELEKSHAIHIKDYEKLWYGSSRELSMNAEMSRNVTVYFFIWLNNYQDKAERISSRHKDEEKKLDELAKLLALFGVQSKKLFPELSLDNPLVKVEIRNFMNDIAKLYSIEHHSNFFLMVEQYVCDFVQSEDLKDQIMPNVNSLKKYCVMSQVENTYL